jgi:hypothetical protein
MNVLIFGASGATGRVLVKQALLQNRPQPFLQPIHYEKFIFRTDGLSKQQYLKLLW